MFLQKCFNFLKGPILIYMQIFYPKDEFLSQITSVRKSNISKNADISLGIQSSKQILILYPIINIPPDIRIFQLLFFYRKYKEIGHKNNIHSEVSEIKNDGIISEPNMT